MAFKGGKVYMPFGTPGGDVQPQAMLQVFLNVNVFGMDPQTAIEAPRFANYSYPGSFEPHPYFPGFAALESRAGEVTSAQAIGHKVERWEDWTGPAGAPSTIAARPAERILHGGADPRRVASALGRLHAVTETRTEEVFRMDAK